MKKIKILFLFFLSFTISSITNAQGAGKEIELEEIEVDEETKKENEKEVGEKSKTETKEIVEEKKENTNSKNKITENVGSDGHVYNGDKRHENRQFLTFTTKAGKSYYLIIDYTKESEQVQFLTEIDETEMSNIIKEVNKNKQQTKEDKENKKELNKEDLEKFKEELKSEISKNTKLDTNSRSKKSILDSIGSDNLLLIAFVLGIGGFFFYKKKQKEKEQKEEDDYVEKEDIGVDELNFDDEDEEE